MDVDVLQLSGRVAALLGDLTEPELRDDVMAAFKAFIASLEGPESAVVPRQDDSGLPALSALIEAGYKGVAFCSLPLTISAKESFLRLLRMKIEGSVDDYEVRMKMKSRRDEGCSDSSATLSLISSEATS